MAKDPAVNWYFDNWDGGTKLLTRHQKGCYIDLLSAQFHCGRLTIENIKTILGPDFSEWQKCLFEKFEADENGKFFNGRMEHEIEKRSKERNKKSAGGAKAMKKRWGDKIVNNIVTNSLNKIDNNSLELELELKDETKKEGGTGETFPKPTDCMEPSKDYFDMCHELVSRVQLKKIDRVRVVDLWPVFKIQNLTGKKYYADVGAVHSHFMNWIKTQKFEIDATGKTQSRYDAVKALM